MYLSESEKGSGINGPDGYRDGIAIHQYDRKGAIGCITTAEHTKGYPLVNELYNNVCDVYLHNKKKMKEVNMERRYVRVILEEREVTEGTWDKTAYGTKKWTGIIEEKTDE